MDRNTPYRTWAKRNASERVSMVGALVALAMFIAFLLAIGAWPLWQVIAWVWSL